MCAGILLVNFLCKKFARKKEVFTFAAALTAKFRGYDVRWDIRNKRDLFLFDISRNR